MARFIIDLDEDAARWLRSQARKRGVSASRIVREVLAEARGGEPYPGVRRTDRARLQPPSSGEPDPNRLSGKSQDPLRPLPPSIGLAEAWKALSRPEPRQDASEIGAGPGPVRPRISAEDISDAEPRIPKEILARARKHQKGGEKGPASFPKAAPGPGLAEEWKRLNGPEGGDSGHGGGEPGNSDEGAG